MSIQRYKEVDEYGYVANGLENDNNGEWVKYTDHLAEITSLKAQRDELLYCLMLLVNGNDIAYDRGQSIEGWKNSHLHKLSKKIIAKHEVKHDVDY